jgi:hypothetical protein
MPAPAMVAGRQDTSSSGAQASGKGQARMGIVKLGGKTM